MFPYFIVFGRMITTYALLSIVGAFVAGIVACRMTRKLGKDDTDTIVLLLVAGVGALVGGHILYGITHYKYIPLLFRVESFDEFWELATAIFGGAVFYGGLFCAILLVALTIRIKKLEFPVFSDIIATVAPLFHAFARVGCFLGGCCYGIESPFGFTVHHNDLVPSINGVSRFPVQLLEALLNLGLFFLLYHLYQKSLSDRRLHGKILPIYLCLYAVIRFFDEFLRGDEIRGFVLGLSTSQFISVLSFLIAGTYLLIAWRRAKRHPNP